MINAEQYNRISNIIDTLALIDFPTKMENEILDLLCDLIEEWDIENGL